MFRYFFNALPFILFGSMAAAVFVTRSRDLAAFTLNAFFYGSILATLEQYFFVRVLPRESTTRPDRSCLLTSGFPSAHAQLFVFTLVWLVFSRADIWVLVAWSAVVAAVCAQRFQSGCHSVTQVVAGGGFGAMLALIVVNQKSLRCENLFSSVTKRLFISKFR